MSKYNFQEIPVIDTTREITGTIKKQDVACAIQGDPTQCIFHNAIHRTLGVPGEDVRTGATTTYLRHDHHWERFQHDSMTIKRIKEFDRHPEKVRELASYLQGMTFKLTPPSASNRIGARMGKKSGSNKREGYQKSVRSKEYRRVTSDKKE